MRQISLPVSSYHAVIALILLLGLGSGSLAVAQETTPPTMGLDVQELLQRLENAEQRIQELESRPDQLSGPNGDGGLTGTANVDLTPQYPVNFLQNAPPAPSGTVGTELEPDAIPGLEPITEQSDDDEDEDQSSFSEQLDDLSDRLDEHEGIIKSLNSDVDGFVLSGTSTSTMKVAGRVHIDGWGYPGDSPGVNVFEYGDPEFTPQNRLGFRRIRFGVRGKVEDQMNYRIEMEFASGNDVEFRDVWIGFEDLPIFQTLLIGNQKRPYGLDHINSSRYNVFIERPFIIEAFNIDARRLGIESYGVSDDEVFNWRFGVFNQRLIQDEGQYISDHLQGQVAGRFASTYWWDEETDGRYYAHAAIAGTIAEPDGDPNPVQAANEARFRHRPEARTVSRWLDTEAIAGADWYRLLALEHVVNFGPLQIVGEYQFNTVSRTDIILPPGIDEDVFLHGGYVYASYFLTGEHMPWERKTGMLGRIKPFENFYLADQLSGNCGEGKSGWGAWQVAARYSYADLTDEDIFGGVGESITLGMVWYWNANANLQANYIWGNISERMVEVDDQVFTEGDYEALGVRARIDF
ncbi:OprO/OprP family phosphate-selective porin [Thalassoroseus pseudoceratinae]|uniref:OprO/OprP family phosphate-selective porin n=1 Tax=Thalassoroseus pseudoceratinae TaxID=2713176 RepID=UPI00197E20D6|nr:porin [Thalassoroseus pseudoceratinae]